MQDVLTTAIEMHQGGRLGEAATLYQKVLAQEKENAVALHLLGVLHHQQGDHARAVELIGRAVALRPNVPAFHANLAEAYRALGQLERAAGCCRAALGLWPDYPEALCNLGLALQGLGKKAEAVEQFRRALELRPEFATAHNNLGIVLRELGRLDEALEHFRRAVELEPTFAPARTNLGQMLLDRGQAEEALPHCQEAVRLQPDLAALHHNLGNALRALERLVEARALVPRGPPARARPGPGPRPPRADHVREGQLDEALPWLKQAVELDPANATFWEILAELYMEREEPGEAIPCWERVLALAEEPSGRACTSRWAGRCRRRAGWPRPARTTRRRCGSSPTRRRPSSTWAGSARSRARWTEAEAAFRTALRLQPNFPIPHARLATLLRGKLPDADLAALEQRLADPELAQGPRARLLFGLAHVLDARGDYARAADCLREANALSLELAKGHREYVPAEHERFVDGLLRAFDAEFFARTAGCGPRLAPAGLRLRPAAVGHDADRAGPGQPLADPRRRRAAAGPAVLRGDPRACWAGPGRRIECVPHLDGPALRRLAEQHLERLARHRRRPGRPRIVDKMPDNYMYLGLLAVLFPRATFIHCRRDLRDVAVSCWMTDFRSIRWANDPEHIASRFQQYRRLMDHWQAVLPAPIHEVDYEETVDDLEAVARRLIAACGLEWEPACLEFHRTERPVRTASVTQVRQPVYKRSVARWKNYESALADLFAALPHA